MKAGRFPIWQIYLAVGLTVMVLYGFVPPVKGNGPVMNLIGLSAVISVFVGLLKYRPKAIKAWLLFGVGLFTYWLGDLYTYTYPQLFHADVPFPSPGDALYVAMYPILMAGLLIMVRRRNPGTDQSGVIDSLIITAGFALLAWTALIAPQLHDDTLTLIGKGVSISYPMGDVLLLAAAIRLAVGSGARNSSFYLLIASIVTLLVTDFVYGLLVLAGTFNFQWWLDWGWICFTLLWGAAALHPSMSELAEPSFGDPPRLTRLRLLALSAASLIAPTMLMIHEARSNDYDMMVVVGTSVALVGLVVARMSGLVHQQEHAADRERILAGAGADLVGATGRDEILDAALDAAVAFAGSDATVLLCELEGQQANVLCSKNASDVVGTEWSLSARTTRRVATLSIAEKHHEHLDGDLATGLRAADAHTDAFALPFDVRGGMSGLVVITTRGRLTAESQNALRTLVQQVSLALETAMLTEEMHRRAGEARFSTLVKQSSDLITVLDADGTIVYQSPSIESVLGYTPDEVIGTAFERLLPISERPRLSNLLADDPATEGTDTQVIECALDHADGSRRQFEILHTNLLSDEHVQGIVLNSRDISERKAFEEQLAHQAFHDPVTGLANRALFSERVRHAVSRTRRGQLSLGVVFIDLDDFKTVNDSLGHTAGDMVLVEVAKRLDGSIRASDTAARFGGDEFAILLEDLESPQEAADAAERVLEVLTEPLIVADKELYIRASLGIAVMDAGTSGEAQELIRDADVAMYMAKREGKGTYRLFEPDMHAGVLDRLELRADLQRALAQDQFELDFQPIVRLSDGHITGVEALVRWRHPERGLLGPDWFIPLAEETGLIVPIGTWVMDEACRHAVEMQQLHTLDTPLSVSVNLSLKQLQHAEVVDTVRGALQSSGIDPATLTLEITETLMMTDPELAVQRLADLKALGVKLSMDDFGSGYSSLSYLSQFPVNELKMDRSFLTEGATPKAGGLTAAILALGQSLELTVVAEGIEHREQWMKLRELGCELGQGYYFARPMSAEAMIEFLRAHKEGRAPGFDLASVADAT